MGSLFFPTLETFFFHPQDSFFPTLWNLFFPPSQNLLFSPCTLSFSPCSMFLSPFTLFFSPFTLSFSPSTLSFQPSAGEAGNPWNLHRERCHLRFVSHRLFAPAKPLFSPQELLVTNPSEPSGNCAETVRNDGNRRKLTRTPPEREAAQDPSIHACIHPSTECQPTDQPTKQQRGQANKPTKQPASQATKPHNPVLSPKAVDIWLALQQASQPTNTQERVEGQKGKDIG